LFSDHILAGLLGSAALKMPLKCELYTDSLGANPLHKSIHNPSITFDLHRCTNFKAYLGTRIRPGEKLLMGGQNLHIQEAVCWCAADVVVVVVATGLFLSQCLQFY
jgi:hypothetical protein